MVALAINSILGSGISGCSSGTEVHLRNARNARTRDASTTTALISPRMGDRGSEQARWRRSLRRELAGLVALKVAALALLWWLFFSPVHRITVDAEAASRRFGMEPPQVQRLHEVHLSEPQPPAGRAGSGAAQ
jgi:hypothetical protein